MQFVNARNYIFLGVGKKILDNIYSHLLFYIENEFVRLYGKLSPSVTGIDEAITRVKKSKTGEWGNSIEIGYVGYVKLQYFR